MAVVEIDRFNTSSNNDLDSSSIFDFIEIRIVICVMIIMKAVL